MSRDDVRELLTSRLRELTPGHAALRLTRMSFPGTPRRRTAPVRRPPPAALATAGRPAEHPGFPSPCDLRLYRAFASAACGPGSLAQTHAPDEHVGADDLVHYAEVISHLIVKTTGADLKMEETL
ncbi:hypothetical protein [Micromonospora sp. MW-13]|uniref:hypothetical protein n=1 Tax=Micromonospora sp. MW-13 TaxID=2094022 RepID=UPI001FB347AD|nr:hypothetical protein [Micromonospora sp. MW-13]